VLRIALLIVALVAGGSAAWIVFNKMGEPAAVATIVQPATPVAMQEVLVASTDLGLGQMLTKKNVRWQPWPQSAVIQGYIVQSARPDAIETFTNSFVRSRISSGEPIRDEKLAPTNAGFLSTLLPSGKRAVAVRVSAESAAGGFILPNDRVDVLLTIATSGTSEHITRTILKNVPVLAVDQTVDEKTKNDKSSDKSKENAVVLGKTATLELEPSQVEVLISGEATGTISLALRSAADIAERPPLTSLQSSQSVRRYKIGTIDVVEMVVSKRSVEITEPRKILGPSWATERAAPNDPQQAQRNTVGSAAK
jgi:pilus assembly protein CpaB